MTGEILLVRHTAVARAWIGRCYGISDMGLSRAGTEHACVLATELADWQPARIIHSGLRRARVLADRVQRLTGVLCVADAGWRERDFGAWEGRRWSAIYRDTGSAMDGMIDAPAVFRPGGGETTAELASRVMAAAARLPPGRTMVITHGGPIAAVMGSRKMLPVRDWMAMVPPCGGRAILTRPGD